MLGHSSTAIFCLFGQRGRKRISPIPISLLPISPVPISSFPISSFRNNFRNGWPPIPDTGVPSRHNVGRQQYPRDSGASRRDAISVEPPFCLFGQWYRKRIFPIPISRVPFHLFRTILETVGRRFRIQVSLRDTMLVDSNTHVIPVRPVGTQYRWNRHFRRTSPTRAKRGNQDGDTPLVPPNLCF